MSDPQNKEEMEHEAHLRELAIREKTAETESHQPHTKRLEVKATVAINQADNNRRITIAALVLLGVLGLGLMIGKQWQYVGAILTGALGLVSGVKIGEGKINLPRAQSPPDP